MNREIEFRGISKTTNEWVYGSLLLEYYSTRYGKITAICFNENGITKRHPVKLETVGQYTGVKDKNGKKIFENDIISYTQHLFNTEHIVEKSKTVKWDHDKWNIFSSNAGESNIEIIGNIHETNKTTDSSEKKLV